MSHLKIWWCFGAADISRRAVLISAQLPKGIWFSTCYFSRFDVMQAAKAETQLFIFFSHILWNLADFIFSLNYLKLIFMNFEFEGKIQVEVFLFCVLFTLNELHSWIHMHVWYHEKYIYTWWGNSQWSCQSTRSPFSRLIFWFESINEMVFISQMVNIEDTVPHLNDDENCIPDIISELIFSPF